METLTPTLDHRVVPLTVSAGEGHAQAQPWARTLWAAALGQVALLTLLSLVSDLNPAGWLAAAGYTAVVFSGLASGLRRTGRVAFGPADKVTLARSALVGCVTALVADTGHQPALLVGLTVVALLLDGVDGQVARRTGTASELGARFDMEVDAFLILVLSAFVAGQFGLWVLAIGLMRYAFIAAGWIVPWLRVPIPPSMAAKVVAAAQGAVLIVAAASLMPPVIMAGIVAGALAALVWSFGRSVLWLYRHECLIQGAGRPE
ncbi:CDP-alcohol phosphatidyltransferase family protein [Actinophytocola sp.]|uniref:CDP-alcohol phosphatidyltransferase family protein n=1 Tax=Actinophytocola sp. TaxID=1872138 RepID=UPI0039C8918B